MATHAGVALELGIKRPGPSGGSGIKMMSPQMEAILIWCQCRVRDYVSTHRKKKCNLEKPKERKQKHIPTTNICYCSHFFIFIAWRCCTI